MIKELQNLRKHFNELDDKVNFDTNFYDTIKNSIDKEIRVEELCNEFNFDIRKYWRYSTDPSGGFVQFKDDSALLLMGEEYHRTISYSDDCRQPNNEWLYVLGFSTGPYIFHSGYYLKDLFIEFFNDLKSYEPKYCDTANHSLYFAPDNAKGVLLSWRDVFNKYQKKVSEYVKKEEIKKLEAKLNSLKTS